MGRGGQVLDEGGLEMGVPQLAGKCSPPLPRGKSIPPDPEMDCQIFVFNKEMNTGLSLAPTLTHVRGYEAGKRESSTQTCVLEA